MLDKYYIHGKRYINPLVISITANNMVVFDYILEQGVDFQQSLNNSDTIPAFVAVEQKHEYFLNRLTDKGLDLSLVNKTGESLLYHAILFDSYACAFFLVEHLDALGDLQQRADKFAPMFAAVHNGNQAIIKLLVDYGFNVNPEDNEGYTPIEVLYRDKDINYYFDDITKYIVEHSDIQLYGRSMAIRAIEEEWQSGGYLKSSNNFYGYDLINEVDANGNTILEVLLKRKAYINVKGLLFRGLKTDNLKQKGHTIGTYVREVLQLSPEELREFQDAFN